jgi:branched-chain amino acid transport system ATP-binding protein
MLRVDSVRKSFDGFLAVHDVSLQVQRGEIVAVIGPNGAGKTTLFKLITGHLRPERGGIWFKNENIAGLPPYRICRKGISLSYQVVNIFFRMTVFENVQVAILSHLGRTKKLFSSARKHGIEETRQILQSVGLTDKAGRVSGSLSHGDQKVLEIAIALGSRPDLLVLDEPTAGMSPEETAVTIDLIQKLTRDMGLTILFCEHDMELVFAIAHKIMVMHQGESIIQDEPAVVQNNRRVQEAYLGDAP